MRAGGRFRKAIAYGREVKMSEQKIVVPEEMLKAVIDHHPVRGMLQDDPALFGMDTLRVCLKVALEWLAENPIVPTKEDSEELTREWHSKYAHLGKDGFWIWAYREMQRRMFLAPEEPMIGEETVGQFCARYQKIGDAVIEAFRRGRESK